MKNKTLKVPHFGSFLLLTLLLFSSLSLLAQVREIKGVVKNKLTQEALSGVSVKVKETGVSSSTDIAGQYSIVASTNETLVFSSLGYEQQEVKVTGLTLDVFMSEDLAALEEVIVVGYGEQSKKKLSTAISKVSGKDINKLPVSNPGDALAGLAAGVQVQSPTGGTPGEGPIIRIRGVGSLGASNEPLYVVDGYPLPNAAQFARINVSDIQSIEVLKDAASAAIYGSRAANGVVLVTTKRGQKGVTEFNVNAYTGLQSVYKRMDMMNKEEYLQYAKDARRAAGLQYPDIYDKPEELADTDWQDVIFRNAPMSNVEMNARGGSDDFQFSVTGSYLNQKGTIIGTDYQLASLRANIDAQLSSTLKIGVDFAPSYTRQNIKPSPNNGGPASYAPVYGALLMPPVVSAHLKNGDYGQNNVLPFTQYGFAEVGIHNPLALLDLYEYSVGNFGLLNDLFLEWKPIKGLTFKTQGGFSLVAGSYEEYVPSTLAYSASPYANLSTPKLDGLASAASNDRSIDWVWENTLNYTKKLGESHNLSAMLLYSMQKYRKNNVGTRARVGTFTNDLIHNPTAATDQIGSVSYALNSFMSYAARVNYDYKDKYLFSAAVRSDGSSRFGPDNRFGVFQSYSAGWRITEEPFMAHQNIFSELKIRGSYGETGNANIGDFTWVSGINKGNYSLNDQRVAGTYQNGYLNRNLTWEKNKQVDLGLEAGFLNDRIYLTVDVYEKNTKGMLFSKELPGVVGYATSFQTNIGKLRNRGIEVDVTSTNLKQNLKWSTSLNISYNKTKVLDLGGRQSLNTSVGTGGWPNAYKVEVGQPLGNMYGFIIDGVFKSVDELEKGPKWPGSGVGSYKIRDVNKDGLLDEGDRTLLGNGFPDFVYGITNNFSYKNFDLSVIVQGVLGSNIINGASRHTELWAGRFNAIKDMHNNYFIEDDPSRDVKYGRVGNRAGFSTASQLHSYAVFSGSFLRLRNLTLGYTLADRFSRKMSFKSTRIYFTAQNLFTISNYPGLNPEPSQYGSSVYQPGSDQGTYPANKSFMFGLNVGF